MKVCCSAGLRWAALWTVTLTVAAFVAVISLQSFEWSHVRTLVGLLYIGFGVVAAPFALFMGGMCTDSMGCHGRIGDLRCMWGFWCFALFPVTLILGGCLLCFQVNQVLVYLLPALSPLLLACEYVGSWVSDLIVGNMREPEHASLVLDPLVESLV